MAFFHPEHNHWHQSAVALFQLRTSLDNYPASPVTPGEDHLLFVDVETIARPAREKKAYPRTYFECNGDFQGLAAHWVDSYHQSTPLQELDITGIPDGVYYLTHQADPDNHWLESDETNNFTWIRLQRPAGANGNRQVTFIDHSPCVVPEQCGFGGNP